MNDVAQRRLETKLAPSAVGRRSERIASKSAMAVVYHFVLRVARKAPLAIAAVAVLLIGAGAAVLFVDEQALKAGPRLRGELAAVEAKLAAVQDRIEQIQVDIPPEQQRVLRSEKVIEQLKQLK
ncbi:MAG TPA: hypothetical protein VEA63_04665, partial [Opitutus sp.]|nr:hypothetical protein [Opitutus sp.]